MAKAKPKTKSLAGCRAVIYARYSSHSQREASIEQQVEACKAHAQQLGVNVVDVYEDRAISGKTDRRPSFQRLMRDAEKGRFDVVLAWKSNRIGRNMMQALVNESRLADCGVRVCYAEEDFDDSAAGRFALRSMMNVNQFYSENMAEDITRGLYDNAQKCIANGRQPLGYKRGADGHVVVDEPAAATVREIFTRVAAHENFADIARDLNTRGIRTATGGSWNKGSFYTMCHNERYLGVYIYGDVRVPGGIPRIISDELFYKVQEVCKLKKNPQNGRHRPGAEDYLLTGKLRCGKCGALMSGISGTSRNGELHYYYTCQNHRAGGPCDKKAVRRDVIEPAVAQAIKMYCLTDEMIEWIADHAMAYWEAEDRALHIDAMQAELDAAKRSAENLLKAIEAGIITETTRARMIELEEQQDTLESQIREAQALLVHLDREDLVNTLQMFRDGDVHDKDFTRELFRTFLKAVYLYDDDRLKIVFGFTEVTPEEVEIALKSEDFSGEMCSFSDRKSPPDLRHRTGMCGVFFVLRPPGSRAALFLPQLVKMRFPARLPASPARSQKRPAG